MDYFEIFGKKNIWISPLVESSVLFVKFSEINFAAVGSAIFTGCNDKREERECTNMWKKNYKFNPSSLDLKIVDFFFFGRIKIIDLVDFF